MKMTNQEAADILKDLLDNTKLLVARGNAKSLKALRCMIAMSTAITVLENTPDEEKNCNGCKHEHSTDIVVHMKNCLYCTRSDSEGGTEDNYDGEF